MEKQIKIKNDKGEEKTFDVLFSFVSENTGKTYVVYTDYQEENKIIKCYSAIYENGNLSPVDTNAENEIIETMINTISEAAKIKYEISND